MNVGSFQRMVVTTVLSLAGAVLYSACRRAPAVSEQRSVFAGAVRINEVMTDNDGAALDDHLETEDWIELVNVSPGAVSLDGWTVADGDGHSSPLPPIVLEAGERVALFADRQVDQGALHVAFSLSRRGDAVVVRDPDGLVVDAVRVPALAPNEVYGRFPDGTGPFAVCRYASFFAENPDRCTPPTPDDTAVTTYAPYEWPTRPGLPAGATVVLSEAALRPAAFVELYNAADETVRLAGWYVQIAEVAPDAPYPPAGQGWWFPLQDAEIAPGAFAVIPLSAEAVEPLAQNPDFEGEVVLWQGDGVRDRVDFLRIPDGAVLARHPDTGAWRLCSEQTPGADNACPELDSRPVGDRVRRLLTKADFDALAADPAAIDVAQVKFVLDRSTGQVHLLSTAAWDLHYTFVREVVEHLPHLDRCDPQDNAAFNAGWYQFSVENYFSGQSRRYILGSLSHYGGSDLWAVEYTFGDQIDGPMVQEGFWAATAHTDDPARWVWHLLEDRQVVIAQDIEGALPIADVGAPYAGVHFQPLAPGEAVGYLRYVPTADLSGARLGMDTIVITDDVPNDIPFVGGLITEAFQTPLAHVNLLSRARRTPNMALPGAHEDPRLAPYLDRPVRLRVRSDGFSVSGATAAEVAAYVRSLRPQQQVVAPDMDLDVTSLVSLDAAGYGMRAAIGVKAAALAELFAIADFGPYCDPPGAWLPEGAFAIPFHYYWEHLHRSGAWDVYRSRAADFASGADVTDALAQMRDRILSEPVDPALVDAVRSRLEAAGIDRARFRSSSNVEDLAAFNGAGLYTSVSGSPDDPDRPIDAAIATVWASLWNDRAHDERVFAGVDEQSIAMGILVHEAFLSEEANGVAVSRNVRNLNRGDQYYINVQAGEATVTNPAPGVLTEELLYQWPPRTPTVQYLGHSSLVDGPVLVPSPAVGDVRHTGEVGGEIRRLVCALRAIHDRFAPIVDPEGTDPWFSMEIEFKLRDGTRALVVKQARPYIPHSSEFPQDCRQL